MSDLLFTVTMANNSHYQTLIALMTELLIEIGDPNERTAILTLLEADFHTGLSNPNDAFFILWYSRPIPKQHHVAYGHTISRQAVGFSRAYILYDEPLQRLRSKDPCGYIDQMFVLPKYRGTTLGQQLLTACEQWLRQKKISLTLLHTSPKAANFYAKAGYLSTRELMKRL